MHGFNLASPAPRYERSYLVNEKISTRVSIKSIAVTTNTEREKCSVGGDDALPYETFKEVGSHTQSRSAGGKRCD